MSATDITRLAIWFGPSGGGDPDYSEPPSTDWRVDRIDESDPAHPVAFLTRALETFAVDRTSLFATKTAHIWGCDPSKETTDPEYRVTPLFWGQATANSIHIRAGEVETAVVRVNRFHYGTPLEGEAVWDPAAEDVLIVHRDATFNPVIDSKPAGNMSPSRTGHASMPQAYNLWLDPESARTTEAAEVHDQTTTPSKWSLGLAVETLQRVLNAEQTFLANQTIFTDPFTPEPPFDEAADPENVTLQRGLYLDQCLDRLLPQYGCGYFLKVVEDDSPGHSLRKLEAQLHYYQRGVGTEKDLRLQAPGSSLDADETDCLTADLTFDIGNTINRVVVHGHPQEREVTIELQRGWSADDDSLTADDLVIGADGSQFPSKSAVHRKWVASESGDYIGLRPEITEALDLSTVFPDGYVPMRRKLYPPLTYRNQAPTETDGLRGPVRVEFSVNDGTDWYDVVAPEDENGADAEFTVLENEIGIYFNQSTIPEALIDHTGQAENLRVRVTGTVVGDLCLTGVADVPTWAPQQLPVTLLIEAGDRFFDRQRQDTGDHASVLTGNHDERDDSNAITAFAELIQQQEAAANVTARITLSGIVTEYEITDLLTGISGRNISFNRSGDPAVPLYVQIVGRIFDGNRQETTLLVQPYDLPRARSIG